MIRFAWRQFRVPLAIAIGGLVAVAILLGITGSALSHLYVTTVANCQSHGDCESAVNALDSYDHFLQMVVQALPLLLPALIGMFWGAPLAAREIESGTFRLAWTQGRTRWQWLVGKIAVVGLSSVVVTGLLEPDGDVVVEPAQSNEPEPIFAGLFGIFGLAPVGYAAFAFAFGLLAGVVVRRTLPAMATTLIAFIGTRLAVSFWVRPLFATPARLTMALGSASGIGISKAPNGLSLVTNAPSLPTAWVTSVELVNKVGQRPSGSLVQRLCPQLVNTINLSSRVNANPPAGAAVKRAVPTRVDAQNAFTTCIAKVGSIFHQIVSYQPANRYWPFQFAETGLFVIAAIAAIALSYWWIRHRLT